MPQVPIIMPQLGESIAEATVISLLVKVGDKVNVDQDVIEVETNKAAMNVTSPCGGRVEKLLVKLNESYPVGAVLGYLEASAEDVTRMGLDVPARAEHESATLADNGGKPSADGKGQKVEPTVRGLPVPAHAAGASFISCCVPPPSSPLPRGRRRRNCRIRNRRRISCPQRRRSIRAGAKSSRLRVASSTR